MFVETLTKSRDKMLAQIIEMMAASAPPADGASAPPDEARQFIAGFLHIAIEAAKGNRAPQDEYISLVIPSIKQAGLSLEVVMAGMVQVALGGAAGLDADSQRKWGEFCVEHTRRVCKAWEAQ